MRIIMAGGTGLIGTELASRLAADGHDVIVLSRNPQRSAGRLRKGIRLERWDGRTAQGWGPLAEGAGAIVNLAGESLAGINPFLGRWTARRKRIIRESRANAGQAVVEAVRAAQQKPKAVIQASAVGYYGSRGDSKITEKTPAGNDFQAQVCVDWEDATRPVEALGVRRAVVRTGLPLSARGGFLPPLVLAFRLFGGGPFGDGRQWWPWIHMEDEIAALRFLIESGGEGPFNLCAPNPVTNNEFSRTLGKVLHRPSFLRVPAFALRLALGELGDALLLSSWRQVPECLTLTGFTFKHPVLEPALRDVLG